MLATFCLLSSETCDFCKDLVMPRGINDQGGINALDISGPIASLSLSDTVNADLKIIVSDEALP